MVKREEPEGDFELEDLEQFRGEKDQKYSHEASIQKAINRVLETGSKEMSEGWWDFKKDPSSREYLEKKWHPDSREEFISSVKMLRDILVAEIESNKETLDALKEIEDEIDSRYKFWIESEEECYQKMSRVIKEKSLHQRGGLIQNEFWHKNWTAEKIELYRDMSREIFRLLARVKHFRTMDVEA